MRVLALVIVSVFVISISGLQTAARASDPAVPPYVGDMGFPKIAGPAGPEEFSWEVVLNGGQELEAIDDQHVEIYYTEGHQPAIEISAQPAHDADGSNVPTTLSVSGVSVITLTVHHRAGDPARGGAPFVYPILAGPGGWGGDFQPVIVTEPPGEEDPHVMAADQPASLVKVRKRRGKIGGRPSTWLTPPDQGKQTTPALVIGRGHLFGEPVEIAGAGWSAPKYFEPPGGDQFCVWVGFASKPSVCGPFAERASGEETVYIESLWEGWGTGGQSVELTGSLAPDVASLRVSFRRHGSPRIFQTSAVVAIVSGELQTRLKQPAPFGYFVAKMRGRVVINSLRIRALDKEGHFVGASDDGSWEFLP